MTPGQVERTVAPAGAAFAGVRGLRYSPDPGRPFRLSIDLLDLRGPGTVLLGRSGSGKTSLLEILLGLRQPDAGEVTILGIPCRGFDALPWGRVGYLPQFPERLLFADSVRDEVSFASRAAGVSRTDAEARVAESLRDVGLSPERDAGRSPHRMSFGQKRRVALASVLASRPELLVLDEPSAGLDRAGYRVLLDLLIARSRARLPFLLATHDQALAAEVGCEFVLLDHGAVLARWEGDFEPERLADVGIPHRAGLAEGRRAPPERAARPSDREL